MPVKKYIFFLFLFLFILILTAIGTSFLHVTKLSLSIKSSSFKNWINSS